MADVFISYKSQRKAAAEHLAETLRCHGYTVWFDHSLVHGRDFGLQIDRELRSAKAVVVLWCTLAVGSRWVHEEVDLASELGVLVPTKIEACELPVGNRRLDYIDLSNWDGSPRSPNIDDLLLAIAAKVEKQPVPDFQALKQYDDTWRRFGALTLRAFALEAGDEDRGSSVAPPQDPRDIKILHAIWQELRSSTNLDRLRLFLEQVRGTAVEPLVEERVETLEAEYSSTATATWLSRARDVLPRAKEAYRLVQWTQGGSQHEDQFEGELSAVVAALPPLDPNVDSDEAKRLLVQFIDGEVHSGMPIPDSYRIEVILPKSGEKYGDKVVKFCRRPGVFVRCTSNREGYGYWGDSVIVPAEVIHS